MKLKLDANGYAVIQDGKPVYVHDDGKEVAFDAVGTRETIGRLNSEAKGHREKAEELATRLTAYADLDPVKARTALDTVKNWDDKKLVDSGQVETVRNEAIKATEEKYKPFVKRAEALEQQLHQEKIGGGFSRSQFIADKMIIPPDIAEAKFGKQFRVEEGRVVSYDVSGNKLFSRAKPGELADFDEALEMIVDAYPGKDHILKGNGATGSGATGRVGVPSTEDLSSLSPAEKLNRARAQAKRR